MPLPATLSLRPGGPGREKWLTIPSIGGTPGESRNAVHSGWLPPLRRGGGGAGVPWCDRIARRYRSASRTCREILFPSDGCRNQPPCEVSRRARPDLAEQNSHGGVWGLQQLVRHEALVVRRVGLRQGHLHWTLSNPLSLPLGGIRACRRPTQGSWTPITVSTPVANIKSRRQVGRSETRVEFAVGPFLH